MGNFIYHPIRDKKTKQNQKGILRQLKKELKQEASDKREQEAKDYKFFYL